MQDEGNYCEAMPKRIRSQALLTRVEKDPSFKWRTKPCALSTSPYHHLQITQGWSTEHNMYLVESLMIEPTGNFQGILKIMYMSQACDKWDRILEDLSIGTSLHPRKPELCHRAMADLTFLWNCSNYHRSQEKLGTFPSPLSAIQISIIKLIPTAKSFWAAIETSGNVYFCVDR